MASNMDEPSDPAEASIFGPSQASTPRPSSPPLLENSQDDFTEVQRNEGSRDGPATSPLPGPSKVDDAESEFQYDDENRLNQFQGLASTWYKHTADERGLATSLDQQRANDLSVHLYNTHALKVRVRDPVRAAAAKPWQSKQAWIQRDDAEKTPWHPSAHWTAWPLPAADVPRREEGFGADLVAAHDPDTFRKSEPWHPSQDLEDELQAAMLRKAKEQFGRRGWTNDLHGPDGANDENRENGITSHSPDQDAGRPSLSVDDDHTHEVLRPSLRHILTKFDDLLLGLHKSRTGHRRPPDDRTPNASRPQSARSRSRSQPARSRNTTRSRTRKASTTSIQLDDAETEISDSGPSSDKRPARPQRRPSGQSKHELGQRDWSDVLGMAAMTGWDPVVIDRAAKRCADLFGETMTFRIMPETAADAIDDQLVQYHPGLVPLTDSEDEEEESTDPELSPAYFCPFESCARHHESFPIPFRWREHLKHVHKLSQTAVQDAENRYLGLVAAAEGSKQYFCPFQSCEWHRKAFSLVYRWRGHLRRVHKLSEDATASAERQLAGYAEPGDGDMGESPGSQDPMTGGEEGDAPTQRAKEAEQSMIGAVHTDGFLQPITGQLGRGKDKGRRRRSTTGEHTGSPKKRRVAGSDDEVEDNIIIE